MILQTEQTIEEYVLSPLDKLACSTVDNAFERNREYWKHDHERQHRLFNMVMGAVQEGKPSDTTTGTPNSTNIAGYKSEGATEADRSNIKTGVSWMIHQIIYSILKNSLFAQGKNVKFEGTRLRPVLLAPEQMEDYCDFLLSDEAIPINKPLRQALWDLTSHGTSVPRPHFLNDIRRLWDGQQEFDKLVYSGPAFTVNASWDTFPTAGSTDPKEIHEVIFLESVFPYQLREWEAAGLIQNVDECLKGYTEPSFKSKESGTYESKDPRASIESHLEVDAYGKIDVLIYWGLFPLNKYEEYLDDSGKDRSADEVECVIIKPVGKSVILCLKRNIYFHQLKEAIFAKYFDIPGQFWGESIFGIMEKMLVHQENWFNIIQDAASAEVFRDEAIPKSVDQSNEQQKGFGKRWVIGDEEFEAGLIPKMIERGPAILPDTYEHRNYLDRVVQEISGVMDFLRGATGEIPKTATEIQKLAQSINIRFEQTALDVQASLMQPAVAWMVSMLTQFSDDNYVQAYTGLPFNPFKQFDAMIPNSGYKITLEGSIRAIKNITLQSQLMAFIEQAKGLPPQPDENGQLVVPNVMKMFFDEMRMAGLSDADKYKMAAPLPPPILPSIGSQPNPGVGNVPGA